MVGGAPHVKADGRRLLAAVGLVVLAGLAVEAATPASLRAQTTDPADLVAYQIPEGQRDAIHIDGLMGEAFWADVPVATGFTQREPQEGQPATERTEVRIAYDAEALYVAVMAYDSEPDAVVARILQRDKLMEFDYFGAGIRFTGDDGVALLLDPFNDHRNGVVFATNPNGAEFEALLTDEGREFNIDWRGVWEVASARSDEGWSTEFAIPWRTLRYPDGAPDEPWGLNVYRSIRRKNEDVMWRSWQREGGGFQRVSRAGHLMGLHDLPRLGMNVEAKPFVLTGVRQEWDADAGVLDRFNDLEAGLDLKAELRPGLLLDLTYNTDFAQVEVDDEQVNLTRFDLFFPEKRDFFLENSGIFQFGVPYNPFEPPLFMMFFSRRIGISDDGEIPIIGGARLTGRVGGQTVGFLNVVTDSAFGVPRENFSVARVKRDVGGSNYIGAMVTDRRSNETWNTAAGVDAQWVVGQAWVWQGFLANTFTKGQNADNATAYRLAYDYTGQSWGSFFNHISVGPDVEAESGFNVRDDYRLTEIYGGYKWRPENLLGLRELGMYLGGRYATTVSDNRLQDWQAGSFVSPVWRSGDYVNIFVNRSETVVDEEFELTDSIDVPVGQYRNDHVGWFGGTSPGRWISLESNGMLSQFYGGHLVSVGGTLNLAPSPQVALALGYTRNDVSVPDGSFTADISSLRVSYSFSTKLNANVLVQYNSLDDIVSANVRLNFIHRPGSDLFIVFTENRGDERRLWDVSNRGLVMKVTYLARL